MVEGLVQGVGFRPFIYRLAQKHHLKGNVANRTDGVIVNISGNETDIDYFKTAIFKLSPPAASIKKVALIDIQEFESSDFSILPSKNTDHLITEISPDIAVCDDCLEDLRKQKHRINYPFINCTNCGPRFSIINKLPYDRLNTTMQKFQMCPQCEEEYNDVLDRRFHAQPVACNNCGPQYLYNNSIDFNEILNKVVVKIHRGEVVAIKGLGGYNLICDAQNNEVVKRLRQIKGREAKPFAIMFNDLNTVNGFCYMSESEQNSISSWRRPIVILKQRRKLCDSVNNGLGSIGAMLPYLPFHHLLFRKLSISAIVYTSANNSGDPIISDDTLAKRVLGSKVGLFISHNRKIQNPVDDSVVKFVNSKIQMVRRARGFVPNPVSVLTNVDGIFAVGAELKNSFCIGKNQDALLSQYIGDLKNYETYDFYQKTVSQFFELFKFSPKVVACDLHPEYLSTKFAEGFNAHNLNGNRIPVVKVQHHHAHIVSCMAERQINEKVIGVSFDGTGYGTDGNIWGGEFLICDSKDFERYAHFEYIKMPGGDVAADEPWRMLWSYLKHYSMDTFDSLMCFRKIDDKEIAMVNEMLIKGINSPLTSSAGRLFDAVACILNLCVKHSFEAEGPMRLEAIVDKSEVSYYSYEIKHGVINFMGMFIEILKDLDNIEISKISAKFHNTMVQVILDVAKRIKKDTGINKIVLSGGVFQNKYLLEKSLYTLTKNKFEIYTNHLTPPNDGGIALGQLLVASNYI